MLDAELEKKLLYTELCRHKNPSQFLEDVLDIKLFPYQKMIIDSVVKNDFRKYNVNWSLIKILKNK